jgi:flagellar hook assembly protein FlgD
MIPFTLSRDGDIDLSIYDLTGQRVKILQSGFSRAGTHRLAWDGRDQDGRDVASGTYVARLTLSASVLSHKLLLLK